MQERDWIARFLAPLADTPGAFALTDDVALLAAAPGTIITMDTLVSGVHFLPNDSLETVGRKLIRVNVSDIHAKGALPHQAMLSIAWPEALSEAAFEAFIAGLQADLTHYNIALLGGDLVATPGPLTLTLTLTGTCIGPGPVRRSGGLVGDGIYIEGEIGWGASGLAAAQRNLDTPTAQRYRIPEISTTASAQIVAQVARASLDVSDGLLLDMLRLCSASQCGAELNLEAVPLAQPAEALAAILAQCTAGDDYRILMAAADAESWVGFTRIGHLVSAPGLHLKFRGHRVPNPEILGFQH